MHTRARGTILFESWRCGLVSTDLDARAYNVRAYGIAQSTERPHASLCRKHSRRPRKSVVGRAIRTDIPCQSITRQALVKHSQSESHVEAMKMEAILCSSTGDSGIRMAFECVASEERKAMLGALKCIYFLTV